MMLTGEIMTPELLQRMARWLAYLEPETFGIYEGNLEHPIREVDYILAGEADQDRLFGACYRAAIAQGCYPALAVQVNGEHNVSIVCYRPQFDCTRAVSSEFGFAIADALIQAHGVTDWQSQDPEASE